MCAHPKVDRSTGELAIFNYSLDAPYLTWAIADPTGTITQGPYTVDGVDQSYMIHDFAITQHYIVLVVAPAVFDLEAIGAGGPPLSWQPSLGTRIAVIPRDGSGPAKWAEGDAFFAWHFANAYEDNGDIMLDFPWWSSMALGPDPERRGAFTRARLKPNRRTFELNHLDDVPSEFPRIDDRLIGRPYRYLTIARKSGRASLEEGEFDQLVRYDMGSGTALTQDSDTVIGEVVFAPRSGGTDELDGYYQTFGTDLASTSSHLLVWDAAGFPAAPVARVKIPQRVPNGLHGVWLPGDSAG